VATANFDPINESRNRMPPAIHTKGLTKAYQPSIGVFDVSMLVPTQSVFAFLGPNGAGKTTTIRMLLGLITPDAGEIEIHGVSIKDRWRALAQVGSMVESPALYPNLTAVENLQITQCLMKLKRSAIDDVLAIVGLLPDKDRLVSQYSLGMRQRLAIAQAMITRPKLLILDEPSNGLDPAGMVEIRTMIQSLVAQEGVTVFLSSHMLEDVEKIATHVAVLAHGQMRMNGLMEELKQKHLVIQCSLPEQASVLLVSHAEALLVRADHQLVLTDPSMASHEINRLLVNAGHDVSMIGWEHSRLESVFLSMTANEEVR
jgi:lantibiotic transport system ATP-binding protein